MTVASKSPPLLFQVFILPLTSWISPVTIEITQTTVGPPRRLAASCEGSLVEGSPFVACTPPKGKMDRTGLSETEGFPWRTHSPKHTNDHDGHVDDDDNL